MRRVAASTVAVLLLLGFGLLVPRAAAAAATAVVRLDPANSLITDGSADLVVTGTVAPDTTLSKATVSIGLSTHLVDTLGAVDSWYSGESRPPLATVGSSTLGKIPAGSSKTFSVTIPKAKLPAGYNLAALPLSITVAENGHTVTTQRSTVQVQRKTPTNPLALDLVVPLTLPADPALFGPAGDARTKAWAAAIGPGSRIDRLLTAFRGIEVTWLVDPAMLSPAAASDENVPAATEVAADTGPSTSSPSATSSSSSPSGSSTASTASSSTTTDSGSVTGSQDISTDSADLLAERLLGRLQSLGTGQSIWWTAYDDPDVTALSGSAQGRTLLTRRLAVALPSQLAELSTTRAILPVDDLTTSSLATITSTWRSAAGSGTKTGPVALLPLRTVANSSTAIQTDQRSLAGTSGALFYSDDLTADLTGADPAAGAARFLADTLAMYQQQPSRQRSVGVVLPRRTTASPETLAAAVRATTGAGWVKTRTAAAAEAALTKAPSATLLPRPQKAPSPAPVFPLSRELLATLDRQRHRMDVIAAILVDSDDVVSARTQALDVIGSTRWRGQPADLQTTSGLLGKGLRGIVEKVYVKPSSVNFFADSGKLPITIANDLNRPVHGISVELEPRKYLLRIKQQPDPVDLRAQSRSTLRAEVVAIAPGDVSVDVHLSDSAGRPVGTPDGVRQLKVSVRPTSSWIYWVLGIVAGLVLVIGLWRSLRRGPRRETLDPTTTAPTPHDAIVATDRPADRHDDRAEPRTRDEGTPDP